MRRSNVSRRAGLVVVVALACLAVTDASAADGPPPWGRPDRSFDGDGLVTTSLGDFDYAMSVAAQADGKVVAAGFTAVDEESRPVTPRVALTRYLPGGRLDRQFGDGGRVTGPPGTAEVVLPRSDGKIVVVAMRVVGEFSFGQGDAIMVGRYLPDGSPDPAFGGGDGWVVFDRIEGQPASAAGPEGGLAATDAGLHPDGRITIAGATGSWAADVPNLEIYGVAVLVRLRADGRLDRSFDGDGTKVLCVRGCARASGVRVDAQARTVVTGHSARCGEYPDNRGFVVRLRRDGKPDRTLGRRRTGTVLLPATVPGSAKVEGVHDPFLSGLRFFTLDLDGGGRPVIAASGHNASGEFFEAVVFRLTRRGRLDRAFSRDGSLSAGNDSFKFEFLGVGRVAVAVAPGGRIVIAAPADVGPVVVAFRADGRRDRRFGRKAATRLRFYPFDLEFDDAGRAMVAGVHFIGAGTDFALERLSSRENG